MPWKGKREGATRRERGKNREGHSCVAEEVRPPGEGVVGRGDAPQAGDEVVERLERVLQARVLQRRFSQGLARLRYVRGVLAQTLVRLREICLERRVLRPGGPGRGGGVEGGGELQARVAKFQGEIRDGGVSRVRGRARDGWWLGGVRARGAREFALHSRTRGGGATVSVEARDLDEGDERGDEVVHGRELSGERRHPERRRHISASARASTRRLRSVRVSSVAGRFPAGSQKTFRRDGSWQAVAQFISTEKRTIEAGAGCARTSRWSLTHPTIFARCS